MSMIALKKEIATLYTLKRAAVAVTSAIAAAVASN